MQRVNSIIKKINLEQRISVEDALFLFYNLALPELISLANEINKKKHDRKVYFIQNIHLEPTNYCVYQCKFCSFKKQPNEKDFWDYTWDEIEIFLKKLPQTIKEIHVTGGVHPDRDVYWYIRLIQNIRKILPKAHIKAFTAIEIHYMCQKAGISILEGLKLLKKNGLTALAGGGAEIFNDEIRKKLCPEKGSSKIWIETHRKAHSLGIISNATMLYGHIENIHHRLEHMEIIRNIQDETHSFQAFIPLKFRNKNNFLSHIKEITFIEDIKMFALARIFFDNIPHIKAYWPMLGKEKSIFLLHAGVDDIDGTIYNSTKIYSMSGSEEQDPSFSVEELKTLIYKEKFMPVERDIFYNEIIS